jgi:hypothetical protein
MTYNVTATKERQRVDVFFKIGACSFIAELKVSYGIGVTKAIREALGQIL